MLPVIPHNPENWKRFSAICMQCGEHDVKTGMCRLGIHHGAHVNAGYCPIGDFGPGSDVRPEVWPVQEHARIMVCRVCPAHAKQHCGEDGASILQHARHGVCPQGRYRDGTVGKIETAVMTAAHPQASGDKCCG